MTRATPAMDRTAVISADELYRYRLTRTWGYGDTVTFIMLNPSKADADIDDNTIRRCVGFARDWGYGSLDVLNLYALRSRDPRALREHPDPIGPDNDHWLRSAADSNAEVICAWGADRLAKARGDAVLAMLRRVGARPRHIGQLTGGGHPRHPLYLPRDAIRWDMPPARVRKSS